MVDRPVSALAAERHDPFASVLGAGRGRPRPLRSTDSSLERLVEMAQGLTVKRVVLVGGDDPRPHLAGVSKWHVQLDLTSQRISGTPRLSLEHTGMLCPKAPGFYGGGSHTHAACRLDSARDLASFLREVNDQKLFRSRITTKRLLLALHQQLSRGEGL